MGLYVTSYTKKSGHCSLYGSKHVILSNWMRRYTNPSGDDNKQRDLTTSTAQGFFRNEPLCVNNGEHIFSVTWVPGSIPVEFHTLNSHHPNGIKSPSCSTRWRRIHRTLVGIRASRVPLRLPVPAVARLGRHSRGTAIGNEGGLQDFRFGIKGKLRHTISGVALAYGEENICIKYLELSLEYHVVHLPAKFSDLFRNLST